MTGAFRVASPPSGGARFRVVLPQSGLPDRTDVPVPQDGGAPGGPRHADARTERGMRQQWVAFSSPTITIRCAAAWPAALTEAGHDVDEAPNGNAAIERLHEAHFDVVLSDLKMGGVDGLDVLRTAKALHPKTAVILMTAFGSVHTAVEAMSIGAFDYVPKPFEIEEMEVKIDKALEHRRLRHEIDYLRHTQSDIYDFDRIIGASGALQRVLDVVKKVARSNTTILIRGETGTGKELIAGAIHHNSLRAAATSSR